MIAVLIAVLMAALTGIPSAQRVPAEPFIPISVWYPATSDLDGMERDFTRIRNAGFNAITTWIAWKDGEPRRGAYALLGLDRVIAVASETGLKVIVRVVGQPEPSWKADVADASPSQFHEYVRRRVASQHAVIQVEYAPDESAGTRPLVVGGGEGSVSLRKARQLLWSALAEGTMRFAVRDGDEPASTVVLALGEVAGVIARNAGLFAPLSPRRLTAGDVTVDGEGPITVSILESADALVIIAINHATAVRKVRLTFAPGMPEAIWQNMEEGNTVHFVAGPTGPFLDHTFAPEDVLVLAIGKRRR